MRRPSVSPAPSLPPGWDLPSRYQAPLPATVKGRISSPDGLPSGSAGSKARSIADRHALHVLFAEHVEDAVVAQDRQHLLMRVDRKRRALAHRQQPRDRIDLAVGQNHARDRRMAQRAVLRVKLLGCDQLLAQVGRGVDEEPVLAVGADRDRGLRASELRMFATRLPAHLATAIPLRYAAAGGCAQDDDAKHDPSPENENWTPKYHEGGHRSRHAPVRACRRRSTCVEIRETVAADYLRVALTYMLISMPHGTSTIFGVFQAILALLANRTNFPPSLLNYRVMKSSPAKSFVMKPTRACCGATAAGGWAC